MLHTRCYHNFFIRMMDRQWRIKIEFWKSNQKPKSIGITVNNQTRVYIRPFRGVQFDDAAALCVLLESNISVRKNTAGLIINHGDFLAAQIIYNTLKHNSLKYMLVRRCIRQPAQRMTIVVHNNISYCCT